MTHPGRIRSLLHAPVVSAVLAAAATFAMVLQMAGTATAAPQEGDGTSQPSGGGDAAAACEQIHTPHPDLPCLGAFWLQDEDGNRMSKASGYTLKFDPGLRKLFAFPDGHAAYGDNARRYRVHVFDVDTPTGVPRQTGIIPFPQVKYSGGQAHLDRTTHRLFTVFRPGRPQDGEPDRIAAVDLTAPDDLDGDGVPGTVFTFPDRFAPDSSVSLVYDPDHHVLYTVSVNIGLSAASQWNGYAWGVTLHAIDVAKLLPGPGQDPAGFSPEPDAAHLWSRRLDGCWNTAGKTPDIGVTADGENVYVPCVAFQIQQNPPIGRHGVMNVDLDLDGRHPRDLSQADVQQFRLQFFGVAGDPTSRGTAIDHEADMLLLGVMGGTRPRTWVYNGEQKGIAGQFGGGGDDDKARIGFVPGTGRAYVAIEGPQIGRQFRIFDTRQIPVPQGREMDFSPNILTGDPASNRIYAREGVRDAAGTEALGLAMEDHTGPFPRDPAPDPDADTHDIDPEDAVAVDHSGWGSGYGARLRWVGGLDRAAERPSQRYAEGACPDPCEREGEFLADRTGLSGSTRDSFFGFVGRDTSKSGFSGDRHAAKAWAEATGMAPGEEWWQDYSLMDGERRLQQEREFQRSVCVHRGAGDEDPTTEDSAPGSRVTCDPQQGVTAGAWASELEAAASDLQDESPGPTVEVGGARSHFTTGKDPDGGVVTTVTSVAHDVSVGMAGAGALHIGEVRTVAKTWAGGRPGTAGSEFNVSINNLRVEDAAGQTVFACGWDTDRATVGTESDDPDGRCDPRAIEAQLKRVWPAPVETVLPRPDTREVITGSPGGAQAILEKAPIAFANDKWTMGDQRKELAGLRLIISKDGANASRLMIDLAAARSEAKFLIGQPVGEAPPPIDDGPTDLQPAGLKIELNDSDGQPLAGGEFAVHGDVVGNGLLDASDPLVDANAGTCTTGEDGVGDCVFDDLDPGGYVITQTAAPDGYAPAPDFPVTLTDGFTSTVAFTNLRAAADINITLTDTDDPPSPLPGAEFVAVHGDAADGADADGGLAPPDLSDLRDDGALQQHTFRCTTDEDGRCAMADVPLGPYTVRQTSAPDGYQPLGEDITFEFTDPGQVADLGLTNVRAAADDGTQQAGQTSATFDGGATTGTGQAGLSSGATTPVRLDAGQAAPEPVVASQPNQPDQGLRRLVRLPAQGLGFLLRSPGEAAPFAAVWLLLGAPIYLLARRRSLNMTTTGQIT